MKRKAPPKMLVLHGVYFIIAGIIFTVHAVLETLYSFAETFHQFRNLFSAEKQQQYQQYYKYLGQAYIV